jgi:hypothetical protein
VDFIGSLISSEIKLKGHKMIDSLLLRGEPRFISPRDEIDLSCCADGLFGRDFIVDRDL